MLRDRLLPTVLVDREVRSLQVGHVASVRVGDDRVDLHEVEADANHRGGCGFVPLGPDVHRKAQDRKQD